MFWGNTHTVRRDDWWAAMIRSALLVGYDHFVIGSICVYVFYRFFPPDFQFNFETTEAHTRFGIVGGRGGHGKVVLRADAARRGV